MKNILLIDDDEVTNFYNIDFLTNNGYAENVYIALNGQEALNKLKELESNDRSIDIIFLDINMPIMNGFEFLEAYECLEYRIKSKIVICMLTSSLNESDLKKAQKFTSIDGYVEKALTRNKMDKLIAEYFS